LDNNSDNIIFIVIYVYIYTVYIAISPTWYDIWLCRVPWCVRHFQPCQVVEMINQWMEWGRLSYRIFLSLFHVIFYFPNGKSTKKKGNRSIYREDVLFLGDPESANPRICSWVLAPNSCLPRSTMMIKDMVPRPVLERLSLQPSFTNKAVPMDWFKGNRHWKQ
jgi:hypothetical protein